ncbi:MAG TPA: DUF2169 domain-containing protein, partial [Polyangiaceae bacterium]|nr:DUF2169 domain-containing protein [Polyangiaceae bacterium]
PARLADVQDFPNDEDNHWDDDPTVSVYGPSDMAPFKRHADVVLVGEAFTPGGNPLPSLVARMIVGSIDKAIEVHQRRFFDSGGELQIGEPFTRMPLRYERAGGGPHSINPVGLSPESERDQYGRLMVPNLTPVGTTITKPTDHVEPIGFGPIAASWEVRRKLLGRHASTWSDRRWNSKPLPNDIDGGYFSCAPSDQRLDSLSDTERIVLEHLHPDHPRLVCHLPGIRPCAFVERGGTARPLALRADTLWIDTTRAVCAVTWRAHVELESPRDRGRILVALEEGDRKLTWDDVRKLEGSARTAEGTVRDEATTDEPVLPPKADELPFKSKGDDEHTMVGVLSTSQAEALPRFIAGGSDARRRRSSAHSLPNITADERGGRTGQIPIVREDRSPSWLGAQSRARTTSNPALPGEAFRPTSPSTSPPPNDLSQSQEMVAASPWAAATTSEAPPAPHGGLPSPPMMPVPNAASAAIRPPNPAQAMPAPVAHSEPAPAASIDRFARPKEYEIVELLWFHEELMAQVDERQAFDRLLADLRNDDEDSFEPIDFDDVPPPEEPEEVRHRREIVAIMTQGHVTMAASLEPTMMNSVDESGSFEPPIVLMSGRLHLPFDELETLKATLAAVTPMTAGNPELAETVKTIEELMQTPWLQEGSGEVAKNLTDKIRALFKKGDRMLDPAYLDDHTDRILLDQRRYQHRTVLGEEHIRGLLAPSSSRERIPTYIPVALANGLPMFKSFPARIIAEAHVQQDQYEHHQACLKVRAFGRVVQLTKAAGIY